MVGLGADNVVGVGAVNRQGQHRQDQEHAQAHHALQEVVEEVADDELTKA